MDKFKFYFLLIIFHIYACSGQSPSESKVTESPVSVPEIRQISLDSDFSCALWNDGRVSCWGYNQNDRLNIGTVKSVPIPSQVKFNQKVVQLSAGEEHVCVLTEVGEVYCWGIAHRDLFYPVEDKEKEVLLPVKISLSFKPREVISGGGHSCVISPENLLYCWGDNNNGQLGDGSQEVSYNPIQVKTKGPVKKVALGDDTTCALLMDGLVQCWGSNDLAQLGNSSKKELESLPLTVEGLGLVTELDGSIDNFCAINDKKELYCWGDNSESQLQGMKGEMSATPVKIEMMSGVEQVAVGMWNICVLSEAGEIKCWGNMFNAAENVSEIRVISKNEKLLKINAGLDHFCGLYAGGKVACWGDNFYGQFGDGGPLDREDPVQVNLPQKALLLTAGKINACALLVDGTVQCWGNNERGTLGNGSRKNSSLPVRVEGVADAVKMASTIYTSCIISKDKTVSCWGSNYDGELGLGVKDMNRLSAVKVPGLEKVVSIVAGTDEWSSFFCTLMEEGTVKCWGENGVGQAGQSDGKNVNVPTQVPGIKQVESLVAGDKHVCVLTTDKAVWCWGNNASGQLAADTLKSSPHPVRIEGLTQPAKILAFRDYVCALESDGKVMCWGDNEAHQIHPSLASEVLKSPVMLPLKNKVMDMKLANGVACFLYANDTLECPSNSEMDLEMIMGPARQLKLSGKEIINMLGAIIRRNDDNGYFTFEGDVYSMGNNYEGQLGDGRILMSFEPVPVKFH